jgi:hypothetical protein
VLGTVVAGAVPDEVGRARGPGGVGLVVVELAPAGDRAAAAGEAAASVAGAHEPVQGVAGR